VIVFIWRTTDACAKTRPLTVLPVLKVALVLTRKIPSRCEVVPASMVPATCQNMFEATAPPPRRTRPPLPSRRPWVNLKMKTSEALP